MRESKITRARELLAVRFPSVFNPPGAKRAKRPLKIGIIDDLAKHELMGQARLRRAVADYCEGPLYQQGILENARRIGLDGAPVDGPAGEITDSHREHARNLLAKYERQQEYARIAKAKEAIAAQQQPRVPGRPILKLRRKEVDF